MIPTFEDFWQAYDYKKSKKKAQQKWNRLSVDEKIAIMEHVPMYIKSTPDKQYRKHPTTYLNGECWEDEIIEYAKKLTVNEPMTLTQKILYGTDDN
jgi:predicted metallopeptidase